MDLKSRYNKNETEDKSDNIDVLYLYFGKPKSCLFLVIVMMVRLSFYRLFLFFSVQLFRFAYNFYCLLTKLQYEMKMIFALEIACCL